eukprot:TRINITY_DN30593_c0_g1_i2.p1 TRINITY_DN30593_c0_g1~~TRINITY_DN30593_c0_g1_i2.p1  ORF type:complete len:248 (-),score=17.11 TRINITY_DN30593_c0_g1_i2:70-813(-)
MAFVCLLVLRLFSISSFGGDPSNLDFGLKCSKKKGCEQNVAFELEFNSFGHASQGLVSVLFFPVVETWLLARSDYLGMFARFNSTLIVVYPVYNFVKRLKGHRASFATCSLWNNGSEWALGLMLGLALGTVCTAASTSVDALCAHRYLGKDTFRRFWFHMDRIRLAGAVLLVFVVLGSAFLLVTTWEAPLRPWLETGLEKPVSLLHVDRVASVLTVATVAGLLVVRWLDLIQYESDEESSTLMPIAH